MIKKILFTIILLTTLTISLLQTPITIFAQDTHQKTKVSYLLADTETTKDTTTTPITGGVNPPVALQNSNQDTGDETNIGILVFVSKLFRVATIVAGFIIVGNFIFAGFIYLSSNGDVSAHTKVADKIMWSVVGLIIIISAYTIAGLVGLVFFNDAGFVFNPKLGSAVEESSYLFMIGYHIV